MAINRYILILFIIGFVSVSNTTQAQYSLAISGGYLTGFNSKPPHVYSQNVDQNWHQGYQATINNGFKLSNTPFELTSKVGFKYLASKGSYNNISVETNTYKMILGIGGLYQVTNSFCTGLTINLENNFDFENFITQTSNLFRYSIETNFYYQIIQNLDASLSYSVALTPLSDHYLVTNPQHQFTVGLRYRLR